MSLHAHMTFRLQPVSTVDEILVPGKSWADLCIFSKDKVLPSRNRFDNK